jgi:hypothetical protein
MLVSSPKQAEEMVNKVIGVSWQNPTAVGETICILVTTLIKHLMQVYKKDKKQFIDKITTKKTS